MIYSLLERYWDSLQLFIRSLVQKTKVRPSFLQFFPLMTSDSEILTLFSWFLLIIQAYPRLYKDYTRFRKLLQTSRKVILFWNPSSYFEFWWFRWDIVIDECLEHDCCDWVLRIVKNGSIEVKAVLDLCWMLKLMYELFGVDGEIIGAFGIMDYSIYSRRNDGFLVMIKTVGTREPYLC